MSNTRHVFRQLQEKISRHRQVALDNATSYSVVTAIIALIFAVGLAVRLVQPGLDAAGITTAVGASALCFSVTVVCLKLGRALPRWVGLIGVAIHGLLTAYLLGFNGDLMSAAVNMQEMPVMAMYLAWFYPRVLARSANGIYVTVILLASLLGPDSYHAGASSLHETIRLTLFMIMVTELGIYWHRRVSIESTIDQLTGAFDRKGLHRRGEQELERVKRYGSHLSLVLIDLDDFKNVNDQQGHAVGDEVLRAVVQHWKHNIRRLDDVYRLGGDEFILLLPETTKEDARTLVPRLQQDSPHPWSWGITQALPTDTVTSLLERADLAMYTYKQVR